MRTLRSSLRWNLRADLTHLHVLYAVDVTTLQANDVFSGPILDALEEEGKEQLEWVSERAARHDIEVTSAVVKGTPAHSIVEAAEMLMSAMRRPNAGIQPPMSTRTPVMTLPSEPRTMYTIRTSPKPVPCSASERLSMNFD